VARVELSESAEARRALCAYIASHHRLEAALYDLDLMPEQTWGTAGWGKTVRTVALYRAGMIDGAAEVVGAGA